MGDDNRTMWAVVIDGRVMVGKVTFNGDGSPKHLDPAYDLMVQQLMQQGSNQVTIVHVASPLLHLPSWSRWTLSERALIKPVVEFSEADQKAIKNAIDIAERTVQAMRAAQSGIQLAGGPLPTRQ